MFKDYYHILGLSPQATPPDIKLAYRRLAKAYHPDSSPHTDAHQRFLDINEAYQTLSDPLTRHNYDHDYARFQAGTLPPEPVRRRPAYHPPPPPGTPPVPDEAELRRQYQAAKAAADRARRAEFARYGRYIQGIAALIFFFALSLGADYFLARHSTIETVLARRSNGWRGGASYVALRTDSYRLSLTYKRAQQIRQGDRIRFTYTPFYGIRTRVSVWHSPPPGQSPLSMAELAQQPPDLHMYPKTGIYNVFSFALILLFFSSGTTLFLRRWPELHFKAGLLALLLFPINLFFLYIS